MDEATFTQDFLATLDDELKDVRDDDCNEEIRYVVVVRGTSGGDDQDAGEPELLHY